MLSILKTREEEEEAMCKQLQRLRNLTILFLAIGALFVVSTLGYGAEYANPQLLADSKTISDSMGKPDRVILDTRDAKEYEEGHIPGAVNLGGMGAKVLRDATARAYTMVPKIEKILGDAGIGDDKHIILYGKAKETYENTVPFWILEYLGCNSSNLKCTVSYYDGGYERWAAEGGKSETQGTKLPAATFKAHVVASKLATTSEVLKVVKGKEHAVIVDARTPAEFGGTDIRALRGGHLKGAMNIPVQKSFDHKTYRMLPADEQAAVYKDVPKNKRVIAHCQTATRSTWTYLVLRLLGYRNVANWDDSWQVWGSNVNYPVEGEQWYNFVKVNNAIKAVDVLKKK
ncbi:MAG: rhodanese-like domain-containing protein [Nitrospirae bacterium]|nr:rhodanese-like domain-containing protein [Nitrospirota bacterium]